ncbi:MAG: type II secretion system protein [Pseudomonadota bacterium]
MRQGGFTYLGLIILVAILGLVGAATLKVGSLLARVQAEEELLDFGAAVSDALKSYAAATPPGQPQQPASLQDLLRDPRFPGTRRHLRKLLPDPISGSMDWGILYLKDQTGVIGIYSKSALAPFKVANFDPRFQGFDNQLHLSDWKFTFSGQTAPAAPVPPKTVPDTAPVQAPATDAPAPVAPSEPPAAKPDEVTVGSKEPAEPAVTPPVVPDISKLPEIKKE